MFWLSPKSACDWLLFQIYKQALSEVIGREEGRVPLCPPSYFSSAAAWRVMCACAWRVSVFSPESLAVLAPFALVAEWQMFPVARHVRSYLHAPLLHFWCVHGALVSGCSRSPLVSASGAGNGLVHAWAPQGCFDFLWNVGLCFKISHIKILLPRSQ